MSYTRDYIFEKIIEKLPTLKIYEKKEDDSSIFILEYKNNKAKIDIDSFVKKLGNKKNSLSDKKIDEFVYYIVSNFEAQEKISTVYFIFKLGFLRWKNFAVFLKKC